MWKKNLFSKGKRSTHLASPAGFHQNKGKITAKSKNSWSATSPYTNRISLVNGIILVFCWNFQM
jgi:hypothetical protein